MASLDWSQCPALESIPGKQGGAWVFRGTRVPASAVFENLKTCTIDEILDNYPLSNGHIRILLDFAARSAEAPAAEGSAS